MHKTVASEALGAGSGMSSIFRVQMKPCYATTTMNLWLPDLLNTAHQLLRRQLCKMDLAAAEASKQTCLCFALFQLASDLLHA